MTVTNRASLTADATRRNTVAASAFADPSAKKTIVTNPMDISASETNAQAPRQAQARRDRRRHRSQEPHPRKSIHPARRQRQGRTRRRHRTLPRQVSRRPRLRRSHGRGNPSPRRAREDRRTHRLHVLVLAQAMPRNSHHRRNQATTRIRAVNQEAAGSERTQSVPASFSHSAGQFGLFVVKSASRHISTVFPSAIRTIIGSTQQRSTASSTA